MEVEVLIGGFVLRDGGAKVGKRRAGRNHQKGEGLRTRRSEFVLLAILNVICFDALDCVEQLRIVVASHWVGELLCWFVRGGIELVRACSVGVTA